MMTKQQKALAGYLIFLTGLSLVTVWAEDFRKSSKITQVVGDVTHQISASNTHAAKVEELVVPGELLKTGADSRTELTSGDATVIRVGANSLFSFSTETRQMELQQGSVLFHTPHGEGGGVIRTPAITAGVTGSTVAVTTTKEGGAKVCPLESQCIVTGKDGRQLARLQPGQLLVLLVGHAPIIVAIDLDEFIKTSALIKGFRRPLGREVDGAIHESVRRQEGNTKTKTNIFIVDTNALTLGHPIPNPNKLLQDAGSNGQSSSSSSSSSQSFNLSAAALSAVTSDLNLTINDPNLLNSSMLVNNLFSTNSSQSDILKYIAFKLNLTSTTDRDRAILGIRNAFPTGFSLPVAPALSQLLVGNNITFTGVPYSSNPPGTYNSGKPGDPFAVNFGMSAGNGNYFAFAALGNMVFKPTSTRNLDISFINGPRDLAFLAGGSLTFDGTAITPTSSSNTANLDAYDVGALHLGSVGPMVLNQACLHSGGDFYIGTSATLNVQNGTMLNAASTNTSTLSLTSGGDTNIGVVSTSSMCPSLTGGSLYIYSGGNVTMGGSGTNYNITKAININSTGGDTNISAGNFGNFSSPLPILNITSLANINISGTPNFYLSTTSSVSLIASNILAIGAAGPSISLGNSASTLFLSGQTINLTNVFLSGSTITFQATNNTILFGASTPGYINFIQNVYDNGNLINSPAALTSFGGNIKYK